MSLIIYCAGCGQPIATCEKGADPSTKEWVKPSSCPKCGANREDIDDRRRIIVRDTATDTISLVHEFIEPEKPKKKFIKKGK